MHRIQIIYIFFVLFSCFDPVCFFCTSPTPLTHKQVSVNSWLVQINNTGMQGRHLRGRRPELGTLDKIKLLCCGIWCRWVLHKSSWIKLSYIKFKELFFVKITRNNLENGRRGWDAEKESCRAWEKTWHKRGWRVSCICKHIKNAA